VNLLLPVLRVARGAIIDNLEVSVPGEGRIATLNTGEYAAVAAELIETVLARLGRTDGRDPELAKELRTLLDQSWFAHPAAGNTGRIRAGREEDPDMAFDVLATRLISLEAPPEYASTQAIEDWDELLERLYGFLDAMADAHIVFAPLRGRQGDRVVVDYTFTTPHQPLRKTAPEGSEGVRSLGLRDGVRYLFGLRPHEHVVQIVEHLWSQSYHLEFWAPKETYVFSCDVEASDGFDPEEHAGSIVTFPETGTRGCDYAHIYIRETSRASYRNRLPLEAIFDCREKPPGMLGNIAVVAFAEALLIWVIGWHLDSFFPAGPPPTSTTDVAAVLLALPGVVAGFLGTQFASERLRTTSLATMVALVMTGLIAVFSTAAALANSSDNTLLRFWGISHPIWLVLMLFSAGLAIDLILRGLVRARRYIARLNLPGDDRTLLL